MREPFAAYPEEATDKRATLPVGIEENETDQQATLPDDPEAARQSDRA